MRDLLTIELESSLARKPIDTGKEIVFGWLRGFLLMFLAFNSMPADPICISSESPTVCAYTKTRVARTMMVYESGKVDCGTILNLVTSAMRARHTMMIEVLSK